ncbi:MAG: hypothetical protein A2V85_04945 [Chloroflexi bacterium RBG_16_72_14]|nr:MAG: hypothetical protein A2V85_04945 [Chloroflexi bacterium RBG_16_72_14]
MSDLDPGTGHDAPGPGGTGPGRLLERAPGERYAARGDRSGARSGPPARARGGGGRGIVRALLVADAVALGGAIVFFALGQVDIGPGLLAAAAAIGWAGALGLLWSGDGAGLPAGATRMAVSGGLAAAAIVTGFVLSWAWSRAEGGVLDLFAYVDLRYGALAWINVPLAAAVGAWRAR